MPPFLSTVITRYVGGYFFLSRNRGVFVTIEWFAEKYTCLLIYTNKWCYIT